MAERLVISRGAASAAANALLAHLDSGFLRIYDGAQPADPDVAVTTQTLLAVLRFSVPAFGTAVDGLAFTSSAVVGRGVANGTATWCRAMTADGLAIWDGSVGVSDANVTLTTTTIMTDAVVSLSSVSYTQARKE